MIRTRLPGAPADVSDYFGRQGAAVGAHDPLYARALVLDDGRHGVAIVAVDLIAVTADFTTAVRHAVSATTAIRPDHLMLAASHTHAGPDLFGWTETVDPTIEVQVRRRVVEAVYQAYTNRRPARVGWSDADLASISINRHDASGPVDPRVGVMWVEPETALERREDPQIPIALVVNFAIHTCFLSAANQLYSADISGFAMSALERLYPGAIALFLNGAAGNINPVAYPWEPRMDVVPVFRKAWHAGQPHPRTYRNAARLGHILAAAALEAAERVQECKGDVALAGAVRPVALPLKPPDELARFRMFMNLSPTFGGARLAMRTFNTQVQVLGIGPTLYVGLPGEPFVELGLRLRQQMSPMRVYVVGYANDDARYVLPRSAYLENRYGTWASMLAPGSGEMLVDAARDLAQEVCRGL
jgi:hypothetical protein